MIVLYCAVTPTKVRADSMLYYLCMWQSSMIGCHNSLFSWPRHFQDSQHYSVFTENQKGNESMDKNDQKKVPIFVITGCWPHNKKRKTALVTLSFHSWPFSGRFRNISQLLSQSAFRMKTGKSLLAKSENINASDTHISTKVHPEQEMMGL